MEYFICLIKKLIKSAIISIVLIVLLWGTLYNLTDLVTISGYFVTGVSVCVVNTMIANLRKRKIENIFHVSLSWVIMAGLVLVLDHAGFEAAAVCTAAAILASPFFGMSLYEGIVGFTLLVTLAKLMS